jgi:hypothetical protein
MVHALLCSGRMGADPIRGFVQSTRYWVGLGRAPDMEMTKLGGHYGKDSRTCRASTLHTQ